MSGGQAGVLEITPAMIEAGVSELYEGFRLGGDFPLLVERMFVAMAHASPSLLQLMPQSSGILDRLR